jgi:hypothetical protein
VGTGRWCVAVALAGGRHRLHIRGSALHIEVDVDYDLTIKA